jgi:hypothetical protein
MKKIFFAFLIATAFAACKKDTTATPASTGTTVNGVTKFTGTFSGRNGYNVSGTSKVIQTNTTFTLELNPFNSSSGPNLKVYLSKAETPSDFINLGDLKSTSGSQSYNIPAGVDFTVHKYVLVHCQSANRVFGIAQLMP